MRAMYIRGYDYSNETGVCRHQPSRGSVNGDKAWDCRCSDLLVHPDTNTGCPSPNYWGWLSPVPCCF